MIRRLGDKLAEHGPKVRRILGLPDPNYPRPPLEPGEERVREGNAVFMMGYFGGRCGRMELTNRRFRWYETKDAPWPFKKDLPWLFKTIKGEVSLTDIASVDKGTMLDVVGGGTRLRLRLRDGRDKCLWEADDNLNEWIATIRLSIADREQPEAQVGTQTRRATIRIVTWVIVIAIGFLFLFRDAEAVPVGIAFGVIGGVTSYFSRSHPVSLIALLLGIALTIYFVAPAFN